MGDTVNYPDPLVVTSDPSVTADGHTMYFSSDRPGGYGGTDIWVTHFTDGAWEFPVNLGEIVNSSDNDAEPSISADGQSLYFTSGRPGGLGSSDIWVTHKVEGEWTEPSNLGPGVNSRGSDREPEVSKDGKFLFFTGIRAGGEGLSDVWFAQVPGAPDLSDLSVARMVEVRSNNPGAIVLVTPSDVDHHADGAADPVLTRRYRPGTPVVLEVPRRYSGFEFWRWRVDGRLMDEEQLSYSFSVEDDVHLVAEYVVPESATIVGPDRLDYDGDIPAESTTRYAVSVSFVDGSVQYPRADVTWSVDDEDVATIDPLSGVLTPQPMTGRAHVTVSADVAIGAFELAVASKVVELAGTVSQPRQPDSPVATRGLPPTCGALGTATILMTLMGPFVVGFVVRRRPNRARR
jgi:hypothetical protein